MQIQAFTHAMMYLHIYINLYVYTYTDVKKKNRFATL